MLRPRRSPTLPTATDAARHRQCGGAVVPLVAAVALAVAGGISGLSWWIGQQIDREVGTLAAALDEHPQVAVRQLDYQRGLFSGTLRYDVDVFIVDVASTTHHDTPLIRVVPLRGEAPVRHGPWLGAPRHTAPHLTPSGNAEPPPEPLPEPLPGAPRLINADGQIVMPPQTPDGSPDPTTGQRSTRPASLDSVFGRAAPRTGLARIDLDLDVPAEAFGSAEDAARLQQLFVGRGPALALDWRIDWAGRSQIIGQSSAVAGRLDDTLRQASAAPPDRATPNGPADPAHVAPAAVAFHATDGPAEAFELHVDPVHVAISERSAQRFDVALWAPRATLSATDNGDPGANLSGAPASVGVEGLAYVQHVVAPAARPRAQRATSQDAAPRSDDAPPAKSGARPGLRYGALFGRGHLHAQRVWFDDDADIGRIELHDVALVSALEDDDRNGARDNTREADTADTLRALIALDLPAIVWNDHAPGHLQVALEINRLDRDAVLELIALGQAFASLEHNGPPLATLPAPPGETSNGTSEEALEASRLQAARALETLAEAALERLLDAGLGIQIAPLRAGLGPTHDLTAQLRLDLTAGAFTRARAPDDPAPDDAASAPPHEALGEVLLAALSGDAEARLRNAALEPLLRRVLEAQGQDPNAAAFAVALLLAVVEESLLSSGFVERESDQLVARARLVDGRIEGIGGEIDLRDLGLDGLPGEAPAAGPMSESNPGAAAPRKDALAKPEGESPYGRKAPGDKLGPWDRAGVDDKTAIKSRP